jgi:hypothetical protein
MKAKMIAKDGETVTDYNIEDRKQKKIRISTLTQNDWLRSFTKKLSRRTEVTMTKVWRAVIEKGAEI